MGVDGSRNEGLQAARAIAALSVAYFHSYIAVRAFFPESAWVPIPGLKEWGFLGVNLFFVISGYVICMVVSKPGFTVLSFAIKRVCRLYPLYWVTMAIVIGLIAWGKYRVEPVGHFLYSMTLLPQPNAPAYDFSWTLEREMVFYALAAIVVPIFGISGLAASLCALAFAGWHLNNPWSFHLVSTTQADFLAGVLVFMAQPALRRLGATLPIVIGGALLFFTRSHDFPFSVTISMGIIVCGFVNLRLSTSRVPFRWLVELGNASYSVYLLHYIVFLLSAIGLQWICVKIGLTLPVWACEPWRFAVIAICCLISFGTWHLIERPMIALGNQVADPRPRLRPAKAED